MTQTIPTISPTAAELRRAQHTGGIELVNGQLLEKPVSFESSRVAARILYLLSRHVHESGEPVDICDASLGYQCFADDPSKFRKPDVSAIRQARLARLEPDPGLMPIPADLVVEVVSPGDTAYDVSEKVEQYLANGFVLVWVVQPNTRTVVVHRGDGGVAKFHEADEITGEAALPKFRCAVREFFVRPTVDA